MNNYPIEQVVPHSAPMILLNKLVSYDKNSAQCEVTISVHSPFYSETVKGVPSYIGCEYMAQTIAAFAGAWANDHGEAVNIGFLIGTRKYKTQQPLFKLNDVLRILVTKLYEEESGLSVFECSISSNEIVLCEAKINVFQPNDAVQFIRDNQ
jgi:predicted hotdog family 3-hydroxylacyl-ACP dehydratase